MISEVNEGREVKKEAKVIHDEMDVEPEDKTIGMNTILPTRQTYAEQVVALLKSFGGTLCENKVPLLSEYEASSCNVSCAALFANNGCNKECNTAECFFDGLDSHELLEYDGGRENLWMDLGSATQCLNSYGNDICDEECNSYLYGFDGGDCEKVMIVIRHNREKKSIKKEGMEKEIIQTLENIHTDMYNKLVASRDAHMTVTKNLDDMNNKLYDKMSLSFSSTLAGFCPRCASILPTPNVAPSEIICKVCGEVTLVEQKDNELVCRLEKVYEKRVLVEVDDEGGADSIVDHICLKCNNGKATYSTMQTRSADEGQTVFYTCTNCKSKSIEYS